MSWKDDVKNWDGKLYKVLSNGKSCHGGEFKWSLPEGGKPGEWTPIINDAIMCERGYHLTTHYAHWSGANVEVYEAEGDVVKFDGYDKVVCSRVRLLKRIENPFPDENNNSGNYNSGCCNSGNYNSGNKNSGNGNSGHWNSGSCNSGDENSGDENSGDRNSGYRNSGDRNSGYRNSGDRNSGYRNSGDGNSGDCNSGNRNSGCYNFGYRNSGHHNSGYYNSGSWNSGDNSSGYLCVQTQPIYLFDKPAPKGWDCRFPSWMYFKLLSEGYKASWQQAFKNASIKGVKELINLPNFDFEIFEEISSITEEQIKNKKENCISCEDNIKNWDGKLYKVLVNGESCHGGNHKWSLPKDGKPGEWTPVINDVKMCKRGYHLTTHYAHWSDKANVEVYEAEGDVVEFDGYDKVVCSRVRLLKRVENPFPDENKNSVNCNSGYRNSGYRNSGNGNSGSRNSGYWNSGDYNSGRWNSGDGNSGDCNSGRRNSGDYNSGNRNSGDMNSGNRNSGSWNSGDNSSGYLCVQTPPIMIFNKPAPKGWDCRFPSWMYFKLLPEGYKASWQQAFKNASVEGVRELINLPNFDFEIFEKISSITEEQIKSKLMD